MEQKTSPQSTETLWINWDKKILSFKKVAGYEVKHFPTRDSFLSYAVKKATEGFRIQ